MTDKPIREYDRFILRLPDGMRERLADAAAKSGRSMNAEAVALLDAALGRPEGALIRERELELRIVDQQIADNEVENAALRARREVLAESYQEIKARFDQHFGSGLYRKKREDGKAPRVIK